MAGDHAKKNIVLADMTAMYGWPPNKIAYESYVGLYLNRRRAMLRSAEATANGIAVAFGEPSSEFFLAITDHDSEAERQEAAFKAWRAAEKRESSEQI